MHLVHHLRRRGFAVLDAQLTNDHLANFGIVEVPREAYLEQVRTHSAREIAWDPFEPRKTVVELGGGAA